MSKDFIFFDLGWTLEDESEAQIRRAQDAASANVNQQPRDDLEIPDYTVASLSEILRIFSLTD